MFDKKQEFDLPQMPGVCLTCGAHAPLAPAKFVFRYRSKLSLFATALALCAGILYTHEMVYRLELPVCGGCSAHLKRAKTVTALACIFFLPAWVLACLLSSNLVLIVGGPVVYVIAAYVYHGVVRDRATPKTARIGNDHLVLDVPGYGEFVLLESEPEAGRPPRRQAAPAQTPKLNRSVCEGCGFINFPGVAECKKCRAPLGRTAAV
jgi:ribosomal protein L40E